MHHTRRSFHTLDGLRGIAALMVVSRHVGSLANGVALPETFLAVDLFFVLSGFVIAFAYDDRLARGGFVARFLGIRLIRLYPLYLLGLLVGAVYRATSVMRGTEGWTSARLAEAFVLGLFLVPLTPLTRVSSSELDGPTWTLLPELVANLAYAALFRWLDRTVLLIVVVFGAVAVCACRLSYGTLDAGWDFEHWPVIGARLCFSFFGGVLLFKLVGDRRRVRPVVAWACVAAVGAALCITPPDDNRAAYELALVLVAFPLVVWVGCQSEPGHLSGRLFRFLGLVSYAVYVLHQPAGSLVSHTLDRVNGLDMGNPVVANVCLAVFLALMVVATWLVDKYYDAPVRRWLGQRWSARHRGRASESVAG